MKNKKESPKDFRVLLINPQYPYQLFTTMKAVHLAMENKPPLGILSIGTYLKEKTNFEIKLLDNQLENLSEEKLIAFIKNYKPDVIGITVVSFKLYPAYRMTQLIRKYFPSVHICWGGPHLSIYPRESLYLPGVDSIILGDGEVPFFALCQRLSKKNKITDIPGLYCLKNEPPDGKEFRGFVCKNLDDLPLPDITLLPYRSYRALLTGDLMATAITSRGCPHRCIFCKLDFNQIRLMSIEKVVELIEKYIALGIKEVEFYDETFNLSTKRVIDFSNLVLKKRLKFKWSFRGRVNAVSLKMLKIAKNAGCQRIQYGVEAGTNRILTVLKKGTTVAMIRKCFSLTRRTGIETVAYFILGNPGETSKEMQKTVRLAEEINPTYLEYSIFNISPGTESYEMALKRGIIKKDYWREFASQPVFQMPVLIWEEEFTNQKLENFRKKALNKFYSRPKYILNRLVHLGPNDFFLTCRLGIQIIFSNLLGSLKEWF